MNINEFLEENKLVVVKEIQKMSNTPDAERVRNNYRREVDLLSKVTIGAKI